MMKYYKTEQTCRGCNSIESSDLYVGSRCPVKSSGRGRIYVDLTLSDDLTPVSFNLSKAEACKLAIDILNYFTEEVE